LLVCVLIPTLFIRLKRDSTGGERSSITQALLWWLETHPEDFRVNQMADICAEICDVIDDAKFDSFYKRVNRV
jgi:hypothetical protein